VNGRSFVVQIPAAAMNSLLSQNIKTSCGAHSAGSVGAVGDSSGVKQALREDDHSFLSSDRVQRVTSLLRD
jgi:hypothetical protein